MFDSLLAIFIAQALLRIALLKLVFFLMQRNMQSGWRKRQEVVIRRMDVYNWKRWKMYPFAMTLLVSRFFLILITGYSTIFLLGLKLCSKVGPVSFFIFRYLAAGQAVVSNLAAGTW